jgi:hypothetical protein
LKEIVRGIEQFRLAEAAGKLLRLPTGDGGEFGLAQRLESARQTSCASANGARRIDELQIRRQIRT